MNVNFEKKDSVNAVLTVEFEANDYAADVKKELNRLGQTQRIKGFRPGHVPASVLQRLFGPEVKAQVVDRMATRALTDYIINNKLAILGEPMLQQGTSVDLKNNDNFEFKFDLGLAPEFEVKADKNLTVPYYHIEVSQEMVDKQSEGYRKNYGKQVPGEKAAIDSMVRGSVIELDENGNEVEGGIYNERTVLSPRYVNESQRDKFIDVKVGDQIIYNPAEATSSAAELSAMLNIDKDKAEQVKANFKMTVEEIMVTEPAELNQEFFDSVLGKDQASNEEEYFAKLKETIAAQLVADSNYRFTIDVENALFEQVGTLELPEDFLKRLLLSRNEKLTQQEVDEQFPATKKQLQWQLIKDKLAQQLEVKVDDEDRKRMARFLAAQQLAQYGIYNAPEDVVNNFADRMMKDERSAEQIETRVFDDKFFAALKDAVTLDEKTVSVDEFNKLFESK